MIDSFRDKTFLYLVLYLQAFIACEKVVDLRPEVEGHIVVECILSEDTVQTLRLSLTDIASASLDDAVVSLTDETEGVLVGHFAHLRGNDWQLEYAAIPQHGYSLEVEINGFETVTAHTEMPEKLGIKHTILWRTWPQNLQFDGFPDWELGSRYEIASLPKGPVWICGMNYDSAAGRHVFASTIATSLASADLFNLTGDVYWNAFNPQADKFFEDKYEDPTPPGSLNYHWWYHFPKEYRTTMYKYVVGCPLHDTFLRIPSLEENDDRTAADPKGCFSVAGSFRGSTFSFSDPPPSSQEGYLLFVSVSEEYDRYLKNLLMEQARQSSMKDFASLFSRDNMYGNIENGIGLFGAKTEQELPWIKHNAHGSWNIDFEW